MKVAIDSSRLAYSAVSFSKIKIITRQRDYRALKYNLFVKKRIFLRARGVNFVSDFMKDFMRDGRL